MGQHGYLAKPQTLQAQLFASMTSLLATNHVNPGLNTQHFLPADQNGFPLQLQVPKTETVYNGPGNQTIAFAGTDIQYVTGTVAGGALTFGITTLPTFYNLVGRTIKLLVANTTTNSVVVNSTGANVSINVVGSVTGTGHTLTIPAGIFAQAVLDFVYDATTGVQFIWANVNGAGITIA